MDWLAALKTFLAAFIPAFIRSWWAARSHIKASKDAGAADQRAADDAADDEITAEARGTADELAKEDGAALDDRARKWGL